MKSLITYAAFGLLGLTSACNTTPSTMDQRDLKNEAVRDHAFLAEMYADDYFPKHVVDQGRDILIELCHNLEVQPPKTLEELYTQTHSATEGFNDLQAKFEEAGIELETAARESIGGDFLFIAQAYGFDADVEELIATRDW